MYRAGAADKPQRRALASAERAALEPAAWRERGRSSGVEHNLAKVGVEGSNPFARSNRINVQPGQITFRS